MKSINHIVIQLDDDLKETGYTDLSTSSSNLKALELIKTALNNLKEIILVKKFSSLQEEIEFFKEIKPSLLAKFYLTSFVIQYKNQQFISKDAVSKLVESNTEENQSFLTEYKTYILQLMEYNEDQEKEYFVRKQFSPPMNDVLQKVLLNPNFCTFHSEILAVFKSQKLIQNFLNSEKEKNRNPFNQVFDLKWTQNKTSLIELMYGLYYSNAVNNGECSIKDLKNVFELMFNVDLGNVYRTYHELKNRDIRTPFIDSLRIAVENKLDEDDAFKP